MKACLLLILLIGLHNRMQAQRNNDSACCLSYFHAELKKDVFRNPEIAAQYPGGPTAFMRYLNKVFRAPEEIYDNKEMLNIKVKMKFIIDTNGQAYSIELNGKKDSASFDLIELEVLRIMRRMPKWESGLCKGNKVAAEVNNQFLACIPEIQY